MKMSALPTSVQHCAEGSHRAMRQEKKSYPD